MLGFLVSCLLRRVAVLALALFGLVSAGLPASAQALAAEQAGTGVPVLQLARQEILAAEALLPFVAGQVDVGARWGIEEARAQAGRFEPLRRTVAQGYRRDRAFWFHLRLDAADVPVPHWWLQVGSAYLDDVQLWHFGPDGQLRGGPRRAGDRVQPVGALALTAPTFALDLGAPGVHDVYLRVFTESTALMPLSLRSERAAQRELPTELLFISLLLGASFVMFVVAGGAAFWLRDRLYVLYAVFVLANSLVWVGTSGLAHLLWFDLQPPWADRLTSSAIALSAAIGPYLYVRLLDLRQAAPKALGLAQIGALPIACAVLLPWFGWNGHWTPWVLALLTAIQGLIVYAAWRRWPTMARAERMLLMPALLLVLLTTAHALLLHGLLPATTVTLAAGPLSHVLHLSVLIGFLFRQTRLARQAAAESEQRARAAELRQRLESEAREDNVNLIAMLAHEIRTPVAVIDAALQSLRILDDPPTPQRHLRHERIERSLVRLTQLVDLATTKDRLDVSNWTQSLVDCDLVEMTGEVLETLGSTAQSRVQVRVVAPIPRLKADGRMLRYALLNLVDNALKYSAPDSPVEVTLQPEAGPQGQPGVGWRVRDRGVGIAPEDARRVFEKYFRVGESAQIAGMGLGLYLVRQIVLRHGGSVAVQPVPEGTGACFACWLPLTPEPRAEKVAP